jgi:hypothetical protein
MPEPGSQQPLAIWVRLASSIVRATLEGTATVPVAEAIGWLEALEAAALETMRDSPADHDL